MQLMPINVTLLASTLVIGGAEQVLLDLLSHIDRRRFHVDLIFLRAPGPLGLEMAELGFAVRQDVLRARLDPLAPFRLASLLRARKTDVLFFINHMNALVYGVPAARMARVKAVVNWHHETNRRYRLHGATMLARSLFHRGVDRIVAVAQGHKDYITNAEMVPPHKISVIYNGVDIDSARSAVSPREAKLRLDLPQTARTVSILAGLRPDKGHEVFLEAARMVRREVVDAFFLVIGDGPLRPALESMSREFGLEDAVRFLGFRRDVPDMLAATDIIALSSHPWQETLSVAMLEAMAAGIPAVVTDVGFLREIVQDGRNGYLVPPGDPAALAARIVTMMRDQGLRRRMGDAAARTIQERCGVQTMTDAFEALFCALADKPTRHP
jgi:glycosyltransferase involved in cell wall biosynthesis